MAKRLPTAFLSALRPFLSETEGVSPHFLRGGKRKFGGVETVIITINCCLCVCLVATLLFPAVTSLSLFLYLLFTS